MQWPNHFSKDCPPEDSIPASGDFYRILLKDKPNEEDFKSKRELNPQAKYQDECKACGLSVFTDPKDILRLQNRVASQRNKVVALGTLNSDLGKTKNTSKVGDSHHTWWVPVETRPWEFFHVVQISKD